MDHRVRPRRRQRHHGAHDGRHHPEGRACTPRTSCVENREGGSGATGWGYLFGQAGTGYGISTTSGSFITTPLQADTGWTYDGLHPRGPARGRQRPAADLGRQRLADLRGLGRVRQGEGQGRRRRHRHGQRRLHPPPDDRRRRRATRSSTCPTTRRASCRPRSCPAPWTRWSPTPGSILGQIEAGEMNPLLFTGPERLEAPPGRADRRGEGHRRPALDAARPDPAARRSGRRPRSGGSTP